MPGKSRYLSRAPDPLRSDVGRLGLRPPALTHSSALKMPTLFDRQERIPAIQRHMRTPRPWLDDGLSEVMTSAYTSAKNLPAYRF